MKRQLLWIIGCGLLALDLVAHVSGCAPRVEPKRFEYKVAQPGPAMGATEIEELLNQLGEEGWLLVHALPGLGLILRR
ncbi:MAG: hypothetical protein ACREQQ_10360 [Candidatus Binatia bacterium]